MNLKAKDAVQLKRRRNNEKLEYSYANITNGLQNKTATDLWL